jgi:hypothetical protein
MASLKQAIADKCKDCIYDPLAGGTWRSQVEACRSTKCPLWTVRPITVETLNSNRKKANTDSGIDIDALVASLPDDDEETEMAA